MNPHSTRGLFVTGTDTDVGKTHVTTLAARDLRNAGLVVGAYKPACSGATLDTEGRRRWEDVERLFEATGRVFPRERIGPQCFDAPLAPPVAATREGRVVDDGQLLEGLAWWLGRVEVLLIEGVGGLLCPLTADSTVADFAGRVGFPLLVVARAGLGTINHTLLTLDAADRRGLPVAAVVLNHAVPPEEESEHEAAANASEIARRGGVLVLGPLEWTGHETTPGALADDDGDLRRPGPAVRIDWLPLFAPSVNPLPPPSLP